MSSSLPVPSKAALTALRGLVVGTSCTLALIAEDRRRKINNAVRVIENGERIKSARRYRAGSGALAVAMEEEALWDPSLLSVFPGSLPQQHNGAPSPTQTQLKGRKNAVPVNGLGIEKMAGMPEPGPARRTEIDSPKQEEASKTKTKNAAPARTDRSTKKPEPFIPKSSRPRIAPLRAGPSWLRQNPDVLEAYAFPTNDEIVAKVQRACETREPRQIGTALRFVLEAIGANVAPDNQNQPWIEATALLCRTCQEEGRISDALKLLEQVLARGPLEEGAYVKHEPFSLIESLLGQADPDEATSEVFKKNLTIATNLFLPTFTERPIEPNPRVYELGRRILEMSFSADRMQRVIGLYRRCNLVAGENSDSLTSWFLTKLHEKHDYKSVVKIFLSTYAKSSPTEGSVRAIGDIVVHSVESAHNYRSDEVLKTLHGICASLGNAKLESRWAMKLLVSHWTQHRNFEKVEYLFELLRTPGLKKTVFRPGGVYRVMVELALEAGEEMKAQSYFIDAITQNPSQASDVQLLGVLARSFAQKGDWQSVRNAFKAMDWESKRDSKAHGRVFVPILKAYIQNHTVHETEDFVRSYVDGLKVPLCSYTVTLMAKQYAAIRDVKSLIDWLGYCSQQGFTVDAAFSNSILVSCRREWNFPFRELRTLFRKLRVLNPDFVDRHTERVMADAALSDSKCGGKAARGRLLSLRIDPNKLPVKNKCAQVEDVLLAMKEALTCGRPDSALRIYKRALYLGMPFSQNALRLAVQARLKSAPDGYNGAFDLLRDAQQRHHDINPAVNYLLAVQLGEITAGRDTAETFNTVDTTLAQFEKNGIRLTDTSLHRAALTCLAAGHFRGAVGYALKAAEARGFSSAGPCYNLQNFRILLSAYAELVDLAGLRDTIGRGLASRYREDTACLKAMKHARARIARSQARGVTEQERRQARAVVDGGIKDIVEARRRLREDGKKLEREALEIMKRAAADAGREPVDFESVPWLGGGNGRVGEGSADGVGDEEGDDAFLYYDSSRGRGRDLDLDGGTVAAAVVEAF
ncbi:Pentatricopeptide repeat protein [Madurella fahalii]|uniref:Pentatricopeptide repeat protein n=1 Tax=Madurella fahalii TaxID=1157608 RepID=A0ABQ0GM79_9PEZI